MENQEIQEVKQVKRGSMFRWIAFSGAMVLLAGVTTSSVLASQTKSESKSCGSQASFERLLGASADGKAGCPLEKLKAMASEQGGCMISALLGGTKEAEATVKLAKDETSSESAPAAATDAEKKDGKACCAAKSADGKSASADKAACPAGEKKAGCCAAGKEQKTTAEAEGATEEAKPAAEDEKQACNGDGDKGEDGGKDEGNARLACSGDHGDKGEDGGKDEGNARLACSGDHADKGEDGGKDEGNARLACSGDHGDKGEDGGKEEGNARLA